MILHNDFEVYKSLLRDTSVKYGIPIEVVERDYWLVYLLKNLSKNEYSTRIVIKGGAALKFFYGAIKRDVYDIDFSTTSIETNVIKIRNLIEDIAPFCIFSTDEEHILQHANWMPDFPVKFTEKIRIDFFKNEEINQYKTMDSRLLIYNFLKSEGKFKLIEKYQLEPFRLKCQTIEDIFVEKLFATEHNLLLSREEKAKKHLNDLFCVSFKSLSLDGLAKKVLMKHINDEEKYSFYNSNILKFEKTINLLNTVANKNYITSFIRKLKELVFSSSYTMHYIANLISDGDTKLRSRLIHEYVFSIVSKRMSYNCEYLVFRGTTLLDYFTSMLGRVPNDIDFSFNLEMEKKHKINTIREHLLSINDISYIESELTSKRTYHQFSRISFGDIYSTTIECLTVAPIINSYEEIIPVSKIEAYLKRKYCVEYHEIPVKVISLKKMIIEKIFTIITYVLVDHIHNSANVKKHISDLTNLQMSSDVKDIINKIPLEKQLIYEKYFEDLEINYSKFGDDIYLPTGIFKEKIENISDSDSKTNKSSYKIVYDLYCLILEMRDFDD